MKIIFIFIFTLISVSTKAGETLSCLASPFGQSINLKPDKEVGVGILGFSGTNIPGGFLYFSNGSGTQQLNSFGSMDEWVMTQIDLNGDGLDELAYAGVDEVGIKVAIFGYVENSSGGSPTRLIDTWSVDVGPVSNLQIVPAKYINGGNESLMVAFNTSNDVTVYGLVGSSDGGIDPNSGNVNMLFRKKNTFPEQFSLVAGDFLLSGPDEEAGEQIALVTAREVNGTQRLRFELLHYDPTVNIDTSDTRSFRAGVFASEEATLNSNDSFVGLEVTAGRFGFPPLNDLMGDQLAVVSQTEDSSGGLPLEYWIVGYSGARNSSGQLSSASRIDLSRFNQSNGSSLVVQVPNPSLYALSHGDTTRDGIEELIIAYPNETGDQVSLRSYRYKPNISQSLTVVGDLGYSLTDAQANLRAEDVIGIDVSAGDTNGNGYSEIATAIIYENNYDLRLWNLEPTTAEDAGKNCSSSTIIGSSACPLDTFLPFPDKDDSPITGKGFDFNRFRGQPGLGQWQLCVADSASGNTGTLNQWSIIINNIERSSGTLNSTIIDDTGAFNLCHEINFNLDETVETVEVNTRINHSAVQDLTIQLRSPRGSELTLMNRPNSFANLNANNPITFSGFAEPRAIDISYPSVLPNHDPEQVSVSLADYDGDSIVAQLPVANGVCRNLEEETVNTVIYLPPVFPAIQDTSDMSAFIGKNVSSGTREGVQTERTSGNEISGYLGAGLNGEILGVEVAVSARATAGRTYEATTGRVRATEIETTVSEERELSGNQVGLAVRLTESYDCYQYDVMQKGIELEGSYTRFCELVDEPLESAPSVFSWNKDAIDTAGNPPFEWSPIVRDWENLALGAEVMANVGSTENAARLVDGKINTSEFADLDVGFDEYVVIDLGLRQDIYSMRLHLAELSTDSFSETGLVQVYVIDKDNYVPSGLPVLDDDVTVFNPAEATGGVLEVASINTVQNNNNIRTPTRGRYIQIGVSAIVRRDLKIKEFQVFGDGKNTPDLHPTAVCDQVHADDWFQAKVYAPNEGDFMWVDVAGNLDWIPNNGECPIGETNSPRIKTLSILENQSLNGSSNLSWEIENGTVDSLETSQSIEKTSQIGAEIDIEAGAVLTIQAGGGFAFSTGVSSGTSSELYWGESLNVGGTIPGIEDPDAADSCDYIARPFSYQAPFYGNTGYEHRALMVDYVVKPIEWSHGSVPINCFINENDLIFSDGFEN